MADYWPHTKFFEGMGRVHELPYLMIAPMAFCYNDLAVAAVVPVRRDGA